MLKRMKVFLSVASFIVLPIISAYSFGIVVGKNKDRIISKYKKYYKLMIQWSELSAENIAEYFRSQDIKVVGIYGKADMGQKLYRQLKATGINTACFIERTAGVSNCGIPTYPLDNIDVNMDAIVVTPIMEYQQIKSELLEKTSCQIISLEDVITNARR